jgi:hypothetical protein
MDSERMKAKKQLLKMIHACVNIADFDPTIADGKYLLANMIAKFSNIDKIYLSKNTRDILLNAKEEIDCYVKYKSNFYGTRCRFYDKHEQKFVADHAIPCSIQFKKILESDKKLETIEKILSHNKIVMLTEEENKKLNETHKSKTNDYKNLNSRYDETGIAVTEHYLLNSGAMFR